MSDINLFELLNFIFKKLISSCFGKKKKTSKYVILQRLHLSLKKNDWRKAKKIAHFIYAVFFSFRIFYAPLNFMDSVIYSPCIIYFESLIYFLKK